ncbi:HlyD family efflux transporter periplasmic adaptor subunit [Hymenobacter latericoloratus]
MLVAFLVLSAGLLCLLHINETVDFTEGQIYSSNPQTVIHTPADVRVRKVLAREGDNVRRGDTLFILENKRLQYDYKTTQHEIGVLQNKLVVAERQLAYMQERQATLAQMRQIQRQMYQNDYAQNERELRTLGGAVAYAEQQNAISSEQARTDSVLYARQAVSRWDATESRSRSLVKRKEMLDTRASYEQKKAHRASLLQTFRQQDTNLDIDLNALNQDIQRQQRELLDVRSELDTKRNNAVVQGQETRELIVRAPADGNIIDLYNARQKSELLGRNQPLAVIAPRQEQFYAKIVLPERELAYVRLGQAVNLKLNAYYHYQFGAVHGQVTFVSPANVNDKFFTIVQLTGPPRFPLKAGYKLKGEIITTRHTLLGYAVKKLFDKIDTYDKV